jgi:hypothetical protein
MSQHNQVTRFFTAQQGDDVSKVLFNGAPDRCLIAYGNVVPTDASTGYSTGCIFIHIDGTNKTAIYVNEGTTSSCDFNPALVQTAASALTASVGTLDITSVTDSTDYIMAAMTNVSPYGFASANDINGFVKVVKNMQTRLGELETACQAAGIVS